MKKIPLLLILLLPAFCFAQGQISKGSIWLGGNIGFNSSKDEMPQESKQSNVFISPAMGIAFSKNIVSGIQLNITLSESNSGGIDRSTSNYGASLFVRRYWNVINRFYAFAQASAGYTSLNEEVKSTNYLQEVNGWSASMALSPGVSFALNKRFHIESAFYNLFYLQYTQRQTDITSNSIKNSYDSRNVGAGVSLENSSYFNVGFRYLLNK
jgi:hypothetical protein